jgi:threonine/homoserine/homoserine lactone efflux protein
MAFDGIILFVKGTAAGIAIAAPVGPVGVLCVRRTLASGRLAGMVSGLGAAVADALFGAVAAFGLTLVADWMTAHEAPLRAVGGALLVVLAVRALRSRPAAEAGAATAAMAGGWGRAFASTFVLTATNPITIVAFLGIFGALGIGAALADRHLASLLVAGVFCGSSLWWLALAGGAGMLRPWLDRGGMGRIGRISGALLLLFAFWALAGLVVSF